MNPLDNITYFSSSLQPVPPPHSSRLSTNTAHTFTLHPSLLPLLPIPLSTTPVPSPLLLSTTLAPLPSSHLSTSPGPPPITLSLHPCSPSPHPPPYYPLIRITSLPLAPLPPVHLSRLYHPCSPSPPPPLARLLPLPSSSSAPLFLPPPFIPLSATPAPPPLLTLSTIPSPLPLPPLNYPCPYILITLSNSLLHSQFTPPPVSSTPASPFPHPPS